MKTSSWVSAFLVGSLLALGGVGCKKGTATQKPQTLQEGIDQLRAALVQANPEVQSNLYSGVTFSVRYGRYLEALMALDRIASDPSLNDRQKQAVTNVVDLLKQTIQNQENAPKPGQ